jgi:hypothetical protein
MNKKLIGIFIMTLLIASAVFPVVNSIDYIEEINNSLYSIETTQNLDGDEQYYNWSEGGIDNFNSTTASVKLKMNILPIEVPIIFMGPTNVSRAKPQSTSSGHWEIETEIIQMELTGTYLGRPIKCRQSEDKSTVGKIKQITPGIDFPAESFFDVYFEIEPGLPPPFNKLHNKEPVRMQSEINNIPPYDQLYFTSDFTPEIPLYSENGRRPIAYLIHAEHLTGPDIEDPEIYVDIVSPKNHYLYIFGMPVFYLAEDAPAVILGSVLIHAFAESGIGIEKVSYSIDNEVLHWDYQLPYMYIWTPPREIGFHTLSVTAYNNNGDSASTSIEVVSAWFPGGYDE